MLNHETKSKVKSLKARKLKGNNKQQKYYASRQLLWPLIADGADEVDLEVFR